MAPFEVAGEAWFIGKAAASAVLGKASQPYPILPDQPPRPTITATKSYRSPDNPPPPPCMKKFMDRWGARYADAP